MKASVAPPCQRCMTIFNDFVNLRNLIDLGYNGPRFTWTNKRDTGLVMKRLDRVLTNSHWKLLFEETNVLHLPRTSFNHNPILVNTNPIPFNYGQRPFRLETIWFTDPSFLGIIKDSWHAHLDDISLAIQTFTQRVKMWNRNAFGNIFHKKKRVLAHLNGIQKAQCYKQNNSLSILERKLVEDYHQILRMEEEF